MTCRTVMAIALLAAGLPAAALADPAEEKAGASCRLKPLHSPPGRAHLWEQAEGCERGGKVDKAAAEIRETGQEEQPAAKKS